MLFGQAGMAALVAGGSAGKRFAASEFLGGTPKLRSFADASGHFVRSGTGFARTRVQSAVRACVTPPKLTSAAPECYSD